MACLCSRAPRGFAFSQVHVPVFDRPPASEACSMACLKIIADRKGDMPTPENMNAIEEAAINEASLEAGEYLEQIGKSDLAQMTEQEWLGFLAHAFRATANRIQEAVEQDKVPF